MGEFGTFYNGLVASGEPGTLRVFDRKKVGLLGYTTSLFRQLTEERLRGFTAAVLGILCAGCMQAHEVSVLVARKHLRTVCSHVAEEKFSYVFLKHRIQVTFTLPTATTRYLSLTLFFKQGNHMAHWRGV